MLRGLLIGAASLAGVTVPKLLFHEQIGEPTPFLLYFGAIVLSSWYGGTPSGLATAAAAALLGGLLFVDRGSGAVGAFAQTALFSLEGAGIAAITARLQIERRRALLVQAESFEACNRLNVVLQGVDEGITVQNREGELEYANDIAARLVGFESAEELLRAPSPEVVQRFEMFDAAGRPFPVDRLPARVLFAGRIPEEQLIRFRRRGTGEERWSVVRANPVRDRDGAVVRAINIFRDVTARHQQEESLRVSREWFSTALRSIGDAVIATDRLGIVTFLNPIAEELTGWPSGEAHGRALRDVFVIIDEGTREPVESPVERVIRENTVVGLANHTILICRDGSERAIDDSAAPIRDSRDQLVGVVLVFRDVSARRRQELHQEFLARATEELNSSLDYHRTLATVARLAVPTVADWCAVDVKEGDAVHRLATAHVDPAKVEFVAEIQRKYPSDPSEPSGTARVFRTGEPEMIAEIPEALITSSARDEEHLRLIRQLMLRSYLAVPLRRRGETVGVITFVLAESNRRYDQDSLLLAEALADRAGLAVEKALLFSEQVLARRILEEAQAEAELANRSKDEFLAILGHELRNPLAPILTALQVMKLRGQDLFQRERRIIERQVRHVVRLVDDLLDVSRITRGKIALEKEPVDIGEAVAKAVEMAGPQLEQRDHEVTLSVDRDLWVHGNPIRLTQVFSNLMNNAAKYTDRGGRIRIEARRREPWIEVTVSDSGIGISEEMLPRIFELFVQEKQALDRGLGGLGLGLAIVKSLVVLHDGSVSAHSEGLGKGSTFVVRLPIIDASLRAHWSSPSSPTLDTGRSVRILVVDDNTDAVELMSEALEILGHEPHHAYDGPSALVLAEEIAPEIALLDIGLPVMDGYELAHRLRQAAGLERIKLVAVTGYGQDSDRARSAEAGFDEHLVKPITLDQVQQVIERLIR